MKKNKLLIIIGAIVALVAIVATVRIRSEAEVSGDAHIGALLPLTREYAAVGEEVLKGIQFAIDEYKENGTNVVLSVEDGKGEVKSSLSGFNILHSRNVNGIIAFGTYQVEPTAALSAKYKLPMIALGDPNSRFMECNKNETWVFRDFISSRLTGDVMASFFINKLKGNSVAVLYLNAEIGIETFDAFSHYIKSNSGSVVLGESFEEAQKDMRASIQKAIELNPDAIYVIGYGPGYCMTINQIRELGYSKPILTTESVAGSDSKPNIKKLGNIYFTYPVVPNSEEYLRQKNRYEDKYKKEFSIFSTYGYDATTLLVDAIISAKAKGASINAVLSSVTDRPTLMGKISFTADGDCVVPISICRMQDNGDVVTLQ